ncbi:tropinone reductase homolog At2g29260, chloroplastic-like isoform X2 [Amborella trichopoda]|uniref:tropinone reductase homolog At2g29260, chloroplastic-like isoform X2 n=1 Tax=Amborella trichopoda TaxID=13333 RepID=UPI0009C0581A|nr:tropinone reductase homolog At2g29260, chloroplastic-like isoform X2 [Amborella trichopoda]|eukprot:XP_020524157.1 tropinone reductase homolog At2g29260, chloroplastic-like isoform X2 [Amborella trichopoda]
MRLKKRKNNDTHEIDVPSYAPSSSEGHIPETPTSINEEVIDEEEQVGEHFHEKVATSMTRRSAKFIANEEWLQSVIARTPMRQRGELEDIAGLVAFLCMPAASFITGQVICVDGGASVNGWYP